MEINDMFHTLHLAKLKFDGYVQNRIIENAIIGKADSNTFVEDNTTMTRNLNNLEK
jgi:hypothetical protein